MGPPWRTGSSHINPIDSGREVLGSSFDFRRVFVSGRTAPGKRRCQRTRLGEMFFSRVITRMPRPLVSGYIFLLLLPPLTILQAAQALFPNAVADPTGASFPTCHSLAVPACYLHLPKGRSARGRVAPTSGGGFFLGDPDLSPAPAADLPQEA